MDKTPGALLVDDNPIILMQAADILEEAGFSTSSVYDAEAALKLLEEHGADFVLLFTDVEMPGAIDGFELARRTAQRWPEIGILVASGQIKPKDGDMPDGAIFVGKPFSAEVVHHSVHQLLPDGKKPERLKNLI